MAMAGVAGASRRRVRNDAIGAIRPGKSFNNFPAIIAAFPRELSEIVEETTEHLADLAEAAAPIQPTRGRPWHRGDVAPGTLRKSRKTRFFKRRGTDLVLTGRVDFKAIAPSRKDAKHTFAKAVEVGATRRTKGGRYYRIPAQPFLVPSVIHERPVFIARLMDLESRLPRP